MKTRGSGYFLAPWAAVLALGAGSQITQVLMLRELLMVFHGSELAIGVILSSWLIWVAAGSWIGGRFSSRTEDASRALSLCAILLLFVLPATTLIVRLLRGFFRIIPGAHLSFFDMTVSCFLVMAPLGILLGLLFVLLARIWRDAAGVHDTSRASSTYVLEGAGAILGGLLFTFVLVRYATPFHSTLLVGAALVIGALLVEKGRARNSGKDKMSLRPVLFALLLLSSTALFFSKHIDDWAYRTQWRMLAPDHELIETRQSPHGTISVLRHGDQHSFFQSGHLAFSTSVPDDEGFELEEMNAAILAHLALNQHREPRELLLVGGGLRGLLREAARHPLETIRYIEFDPLMIETARRHVPEATVSALGDPRVKVMSGDGRLYVKTTKEKYDVILVDVPDPTTAALNRYYTVEFFEESRELLRPGGIFIVGASSAGDMRSRAVANRNATIFHSLRETFEVVLPALAGGQLLFFATDSEDTVTIDARLLHERHEAKDIEPSIFSPAYFHSVLQETEQRRLAWLLWHHGRGQDAHLDGPDTGPMLPPPLAELKPREESLLPVNARFFHNSDTRPVGYYHTISAWDRVTRGNRPPAFDWMAHISHYWLFLLAGVSIIPVVLARVRQKTKSSARLQAVRLAVATTGLSTMAMQVALLYSFQSIYGFVYEMIGLIVALFMAGLVTGAILMKRMGGDKAAFGTLATIQGAIAIFALLMALAVPRAGGIESTGLIFAVFSCLTFIAGLFSGLGFPVAVACYHLLVASSDRATGSAYSLELVGACLGALLASVLIAPVLGLVACYLLASIMNATALLALFLSGRQHARQ